MSNSPPSDDGETPVPDNPAGDHNGAERASAGGLGAYTEPLRATPADTGMAFVLIQHLPADRESLMAELLGKQTRMPVTELADGQAVEPNHVYMIRPGHIVTCRNLLIFLEPEVQKRVLTLLHFGLREGGALLLGTSEAIGGMEDAFQPIDKKHRVFRIRRYTPAVKDLLDRIPSDVGRPLGALRQKFADPDLLADAQAVLDKLVPAEREVASESGREYLRRVLPYRTTDHRIDGVVVTSVDISERKRAEARLRENMDELTRFNTAMVSREGRMIGLKREANDLCRRAGETARYPLDFDKGGGNA